MTDTEIREAVKYFSPCYPKGFGEPLVDNYHQHMPILLSLAESYLAVEGLPEEKCNDEMYHSCEGYPCRGCENYGFNEAIDLCRLAIAKHYIKKEEAMELHDGKCFVCGEETNSLAGNPSMWGFYFSHIDGQTKHRHYHMKCLYPILKTPPDYIKRSELEEMASIIHNAIIAEFLHSEKPIFRSKKEMIASLIDRKKEIAHAISERIKGEE